MLCLLQRKKCFNLRFIPYSINCTVLRLTRCGVGNIMGFPGNQEHVDRRYTHGVGGAGLQITYIHGCSWSISDDGGFRGVAVGHGHLVEQDFADSIPCHSGRAPSCRYKGHPSWGLYHFNRKYRHLFFLNSWQQWQTKITILSLLTCHDCLGVTFGTSPCTVGGVEVAVVGGRRSQAFYLSTQSRERPVV